MAFSLPAAVEEKLAQDRAAERGIRDTMASLTDADLAASAQFWMAHCEAPRRIEAGRFVYDSTFWHAIVPEMIKRLSEK